MGQGQDEPHVVGMLNHHHHVVRYIVHSNRRQARHRISLRRTDRFLRLHVPQVIRRKLFQCGCAILQQCSATEMKGSVSMMWCAAWGDRPRAADCFIPLSRLMKSSLKQLWFCVAKCTVGSDSWIA